MNYSRLFLLQLLLFFFTSSFAQLSGVYTIDSAVVTGGRNFQSFTDFADSLNTIGVSDTVVVNFVVGSGPYIQNVQFNAYLGMSVFNPVIINGNGEEVVQDINSTSDTIIGFDDAKYITIDSISIIGQGISSYAVYINNNSNFNSILNCNIDMSQLTSSSNSSNYGIVISGSSSYLRIEKNVIRGGVNGKLITGISLSTYGFGNQVLKNKIVDFLYRGIDVMSQDSALISENSISRESVGDWDVVGVRLRGNTQNTIIQKNNIFGLHDGFTYSTKYAYGIYSYNNVPGSGKPNTIKNNIIHSINSFGEIIGIYNYGSYRTNYYHNTIYFKESRPSFYYDVKGFYQYRYANQVDFRNNIIQINVNTTGNAIGIAIDQNTQAILCDYNNVDVSNNQTSKAFYGFHSNSGIKNLIDWQQILNGIYGQHSTDYNPAFDTTVFLLPQNIKLNETGINLSINDDFYGNTRGLTPDVGAVEFATPSCPYPDSLTFKGAALDSLEISWKEQGTATVWELEYGIQGFSLGNGIKRLTIQSINRSIIDSLEIDSTYDFYVRSICTIGDTSIWSMKQAYTFKGTQLNGNYTINSALNSRDRNFKSFTDLSVVLNTYGVGSAVNVEVVPNSGPYKESVNFETINGVSSTNSVYLNGNGEILKSDPSSNSDVVISFKGTKYFTLDSVHLVFNKTTSGSGIMLTNYTDYIVIRNCSINMSRVTVSNFSSGGIMVSAPTYHSAANNLLIENNAIFGSATGMPDFGINIQSRDTNNIIRNNSIRQFRSVGIYTGGQKDLVISGNNISSPLSNGGRSIQGISFGARYSENILVEQNEIHDLYTSPNYNYDCYGISVYLNVIGQKKGAIIQNNLIYNLRGNSTSANIYGVYMNEGDRILAQNNSIVFNSNYPGRMIGFFVQSGDNCTIKNNLIQNTSSGAGVKYGLYFYGNSFTNLVSEFNNIYLNSTGSGAQYYGQFNFIDYSTLAAFQVATSLEQNSLDIDPQLNNYTDFIPTNPLIEAKGDSIGLMKDFHNRVRGYWPEMGAVESSGLDTVDISVINSIDYHGITEVVNSYCYTFGTVSSTNLAPSSQLKFFLNAYVSGNVEGILVINDTNNLNYNLIKGDSLLIRGKVGQQNGVTTFWADSIIIIQSQALVPAPTIVNSITEQFESTKIKMNNLLVLTGGDGTTNQIIVTNGVQDYIIVIDSNTNINDSLIVNPLNIGDTICSIIGFVDQYDASKPYTVGYQLLPDNFSDFDTISCIPIKEFIQRDTINYALNHCKDNIEFNYSIKNSTNSNLDWLSIAPNDSIFDNFNQGLSLFWKDTSGVYIGNSCGTIDSTNTLVFKGRKENRYIESHQLDLKCHQNIEFSVLKGGLCVNNSFNNGHSLRLQYSLDNGYSWVQISMISMSGNYSFSLPVVSQNQLIKLRIIQYQSNNANTEVWLVDNFKITTAPNCSQLVELNKTNGFVNPKSQINFSGHYVNYPIDSGISYVNIPIYVKDVERAARYLTLKISYSKSFCPDFEFQNVSCGSSFEFTDLSIGNNLSYLWDFGDGDTSTVMNPTHFYDSVGIYSVSLKVCNGIYCDSIIKSITVSNYYGPSEPPCKPSLDGPSVFNYIQVNFIRINQKVFLANSNPAYDGGASRDHTCETRNYLEVNKTHIINGSGSSNSVYRYIRYHAWIDFNNDGFFSATERIMSTNNGSNGTDGFTIPSGVVKDTPLRLRMIAYGGSSMLPANYLVDCNSTVPFPWIQRDYTVVLVDSLIAPIANFTDSILNCGSKVSFISEVTNHADTYLWDFGDGQTSSLALPTHEYATYGTYMVKLVVTNPAGKDSITRSVTVTPKLINTTIIGKQIPYCPIEFSSNSNSPIKSILWDFGDGNTISGLNINHTYSNGGEYIVSSIIKDSLGCVYNKQDTVTILNLTDTIIACNSYTWIDGITYTQNNDKATFAFATDPLGCDSIKTLNLTINTPQYTADTIIACGTYTWPFNGLTYSANGSFNDTIMRNSCENYGSLKLDILPTNSKIDTVETCDQYTWAQNNTNYTNSGVYHMSYTNQFGCDSSVYLNLKINQSLVNNSYINKCPGDSVMVFGIYRYQAGTYFDSLQTTKGCDSVIAVNVSFDSLDVTVNYSNFTLISSATNVKYQWLDCNQNYSILVGDTFQSYIPTQIGNYAVELTNGSCLDTSACVPVVIIGLDEETVATDLFEIWPNPNNGQFNIRLSKITDSNNQLFVYDINGRLIKQKRITTTEQKLDFSGLKEGIYIVKYQQNVKRIVIKK